MNQGLGDDWSDTGQHDFSSNKADRLHRFDQVLGGEGVNGGECRDVDVRPKSRPILANAPTLVLKASLPPGHLQLPLGFASVDIFLWVEGGEMLADDLACFVTLEPLSGGRPASHISFGIEHSY